MDWLDTPITELGEGPFWDGRFDRLGFVDIVGGQLLMCSPDGGVDCQLPVDGPIAAAAPLKGDDEAWVVAVGASVGLLDRSGRFRLLVSTDFSGDSDLRLNDGKCDANGRFWIGSMSTSLQPGRGALYCVMGNGRCVKVAGGFTLCNGLGWSPDSSQMYLIDSVPGVLYKWSFDLSEGSISDKRVLVSDLGPKYADGLAVDRDGNLWVAHCGAGLITRWTAEGALIEEIHTPTVYPTCPTFGGIDGRTLFVTSAAPREPHMRDPSEAAGRVLVAHVEPGGRPNPAFAFGV